MPTPETIHQLFASAFPEPHASLLSGMIIGTPISKQMVFYDEIKRTGLLHLVVLSGSNISIMSAILGSILGFMHKKLALICNICLIVFFVYFVGFQAPILRAAVMATCSYAAILFGRRALSLYAALIAFVFFAIWFPTMIPTLSFQLSFAASIGIILFGTPRPNDNILLRELRPTVAAQLFTTPILWLAFHQFSTVSILANVLVAWTVGPIMLIGFMFLFLNAIHPILSALPYFFLYCLMTFNISVIHLLSSVPFALITL